MFNLFDDLLDTFDNVMFNDRKIRNDFADFAGIALGCAILPLALGGALLAEGFGLHLFGCDRSAPLIQNSPTKRGNWSNKTYREGALRAESALRQGIPPEIVFQEIRKHYTINKGGVGQEGAISDLEKMGCTHLVHNIRLGY